MIATLLIVLFVLLIIGAPLMMGLLIASWLTITLFMGDIDPLWLTQQITGGVESFTLLAVPMFIFGADVMATGQTSKRLLDLVNSFVGQRFVSFTFGKDNTQHGWFSRVT